MATLIPTLEEILSFKVKPEEGELFLLNFLNHSLDESFEVYFNPFMNGDRPDVIIMRKGYGVLVIEVKDYNLDSYQLDERKNWKLKNQNFIIKSPLSQVLKYKDNLFELHIENLLEKKIEDIRNFSIVSTAVYFHNATSEKIDDFLVKPFDYDQKYKTFLKYNVDLIGRDNLCEKDLERLLTKRYLKASQESRLFTDDIYYSFKRFLKPSIHLKSKGKDFNYSRRQLEIIYDGTRKEQRIKGVVGSGKTTVLAARAVQAHKRTKGKVLILTYNITLKNFIHDRISDVREDFSWENFVILNYHLFINIELNNLGIPVHPSDNFHELTEEEKEAYFERKYYSNKQLFLENIDKIRKYDVILIDEIQDYKRPWMEILKECFLAPGGEYVLFGDVKQNIYNNGTDNKDVSTNVRGVTELKNCFRSDFKIKDLAVQFQKDFFGDKYEIDTFNNTATIEIEFERNQQGSVNYIYLPSANSVQSLYTIIHENAINKDVPPNDITVLGHRISLLKDFDAYYRYSSNEKTNTMFETHEMVYRMGFNYLIKNQPLWLQEGLKLIKRDRDFKPNRGFEQLSSIFVLKDLIKTFGDIFAQKLEIHALRYNTSYQEVLLYFETYSKEIQEFKKDFGPNRQASNLNMIRTNKKLHFRMNSGTIKISTVHSFKGWESETLFLILEKKFVGTESSLSFDEILYTGLTRSRSNLVLINFGNAEYHDKVKELVKKIQ